MCRLRNLVKKPFFFFCESANGQSHSMASSRLLLAVAGLLLLATVAMLSARRRNSGAPTVLWTEVRCREAKGNVRNKGVRRRLDLCPQPSRTRSWTRCRWYSFAFSVRAFPRMLERFPCATTGLGNVNGTCTGSRLGSATFELSDAACHRPESKCAARK